MPRVNALARDIARPLNRLMTEGRHGSGDFVPNDIANLELWLDADLSKITLSGSDCSAISDLSGNGRDFVETDGNNPLYEATGWSNGTAQLVFDAANSEFLEADLGAGQIGSSTGNGFTVFMLINPDSDVTGAFEYLFASDSNNFRMEWNDTNDVIGLTLSGNFSYTGAAHSAVEQLLTFNFKDGRASNNDCFLYINKAVQSVTPNVTVDVGLEGESFLGGMGGFPIQREFPGKIKALLVYSKAFDLAGAEQTAVEDYLLDRAGLS